MLAGREPPSGEGHGPARERLLPRGAGETYLSSGAAARENGYPAPRNWGSVRGPGRSEQVGRGGGQGPRGRDLVLPKVDPVWTSVTCMSTGWSRHRGNSQSGSPPPGLGTQSGCGSAPSSAAYPPGFVLPDTPLRWGDRPGDALGPLLSGQAWLSEPLPSPEPQFPCWPRPCCSAPTLGRTHVRVRL